MHAAANAHSGLALCSPLLLPFLCLTDRVGRSRGETGFKCNALVDAPCMVHPHAWHTPMHGAPCHSPAGQCLEREADAVAVAFIS